MRATAVPELPQEPLSGPILGGGGRLPTLADVEETILGFPAETDEDDEDDEPPVEEVFPVDLVVIRHPDRVACALLILAGVAANISLSVAWLSASSTTGFTLVSRGIDVL